MSTQFVRAEPLQACKLTAIVALLLYSTGVFFGVVPSQGITSLFLVPLLAFALALVVTAEALFTGFRSVHTDGSLTDRFTDRRVYVIVRAAEVVLAVLPVGVVVAIVAALPDGPMAGPGAIGLFFVLIGLGLLVLGGSLVRTVAEYYYYRQNATV